MRPGLGVCLWRRQMQELRSLYVSCINRPRCFDLTASYQAIFLSWSRRQTPVQTEPGMMPERNQRARALRNINNQALTSRHGTLRRPVDQPRRVQKTQLR